ncbi:MAG: hypothetical protein E6F99_21980 [Actinobacteria bacterium]|nr:MAG: hypothetical protein E6F99_21980 [Actinomycetota bacterium]
MPGSGPDWGAGRPPTAAPATAGPPGPARRRTRGSATRRPAAAQPGSHPRWTGTSPTPPAG